MTDTVLPPVENSIEIDAPPARVWDIISDVRNAPKWSSQACKVLVLGGRTKLGTLSLNLNKQGGYVWPTTSKIVEFEPGKRIGNRIFENHAVWVFEIEPTPTGTRLIERREIPKGISGLSTFLTDRFFGGQSKFVPLLNKGVWRSLERIKALAEQA